MLVDLAEALMAAKCAKLIGYAELMSVTAKVQGHCRAWRHAGATHGICRGSRHGMEGMPDAGCIARKLFVLDGADEKLLDLDYR